MNKITKNWDYAELSKAAKAAGGPEKYVVMLELASKKAGKMKCFLGLELQQLVLHCLRLRQ